MTENKSNMQPFQVLEPERKQPTLSYDNNQYKNKCVDPRLLTFCITNFVYNVGVSQIVPFYPSLAADEAHISFTAIGYVFGASPLGTIIFSFVIGSFIQVWGTGRKNSLMCTLILQATVQTLFGCLNFMTGNKALFLSMSLITRLLQGVSRSVYSTVTFAYIPLFWPDEYQKKLGIMESMTALGLLCGPIIGSVLNYAFGYSVPFFVVAAIFLAAEIPTYYQMPPDSTLKSFEQKKRLPIGKALKSMKVGVSIMNVMSVTCGYIYINPFFVNHMASFGYSANIAAVILTLPALMYVVLINIVPKMYKLVKKSFLMSLALIICFSGNMLEAPFWGPANGIVSVSIGLTLVGAAQALSMLPSIPQIAEFLGPVINDPQMKTGLNDMAAALFILAIGIGSLIGPIVGGAVYDAFAGDDIDMTDPANIEKERAAFRAALMCLGAMQLFSGFMFFFFGDGYKGWMDMFRRCATGKSQNDETQAPLMKKGDDNSNTDDEVLSDNDSQSSDIKSEPTEAELISQPKRTVKIRREAV